MYIKAISSDQITTYTHLVLISSLIFINSIIILMETKQQPTSTSYFMKKDVTETEKHFTMRKQTFEKAIAAGVSEDRAIVLS
jgi:hypothetical protein